MKNDSQVAFLGYLHSFRGFAIINIVFLHAVVAIFIAAKIAFNHPLFLINEALFHDSTLYFSIISGVLFTIILKPKGYTVFYRSKFKYVILPYLFITLLISLVKVSFAENANFPALIYNFFSTVFLDFIFGKAQIVLWYIPVLIFLYLITPLLDYLLHTNKITKFLFLLIVLSPLLVSRIQTAFDYILSIETMIYFTGAYAFGMFLGSDLEKYLAWVKKQLVSILIVAILSTVALIYMQLNGIDKFGRISLNESAFYIQKICVSCIVIILFKNRGEKQPMWLFKIAGYSFAIYFLHSIILFPSATLFMFLISIESIAPFNLIIASIALSIYAIIFCILLVLLFRKIFGKNSRFLIGS